MTQIILTIVPLMILILGLSYLLQPGMWTRLVGDMIASPHQYAVWWLFMFLLGVAIIASHNVWVLDWPVAITLMGWIMAIKGAVYLLFPQLLGKFAIWSDAMMRTYLRVAGVFLTVLGALLVWRLVIV
jgi:uncharacterized protein YjeT (DUF2065 family)